MKIREKIIAIIKEAKPFSAPVTATSNLYTDLHFDSLSFVQLLLKIERTFLISIDFTEMESCLQVNRLIVLVENKVKEIAHESAIIQ